jgi:IS30 family transposase
MACTNSSTTNRTFKHLTSYERGMIAALHSQGTSTQEIAVAIGHNRSTIWREINRGTVTQMRSDRSTFQAYFPETGQAQYETNRKSCGAKVKLGQALEFIKFAESKILDEKWSPDAVCGFSQVNSLFKDASVSTKTLYNYIERGFIAVKNIDLPMKVRLNTKKKRIRVNKRILGRSIDERPDEIGERKEFGHWEIDTVIGKKSQDEALLTITERKTRKEIIIKIASKESEAVSASITKLRNAYGSIFSQVFKTITSDNGSEFADLIPSVKSEDTKIYYTHPYSASERGTNERHNGLIRRFIPKGKAISSVLEGTILYVENWCNRLPRKILAYRTPEECFLEEISNIA